MPEFNPDNYYQSAGPLARSMVQRGAPIGQVAPLNMTDPRMAQAGGLNPNLVTPSTLGTNPVQQPMNYPFIPSGPTPSTPPPPVSGAPPPTSDLRTQTGNGGANSNIPGPSTGGPTQQGGQGSDQVNPMMRGLAERAYATANSPYAKSAASDTIRQHQIAMGLIRPDGGTNAGDNYKGWLAGGMQTHSPTGQLLDTRGQVMSPDAWNTGAMAGGIGPQGNLTNQGPMGLAAPVIPPALTPGAATNPALAAQIAARQAAAHQVAGPAPGAIVQPPAVAPAVIPPAGYGGTTSTSRNQG